MYIHTPVVDHLRNSVVQKYMRVYRCDSMYVFWR